MNAIELRGLTILLVDHDVDNRSRVATALARAHARVLSAESSEGAIALLQAHRPDLIVSDTRLPGCDGFHLMRMVRTRKPEAGGATPAIAMTGSDRPEAHAKAMLAGYQSHVVKPLRLDELLRKIGELVFPASVASHLQSA